MLEHNMDLMALVCRWKSCILFAVDMYVCVYVCVYVYTHTYVYIYTHTCTYTHIFIWTHTQSLFAIEDTFSIRNPKNKYLHKITSQNRCKNHFLSFWDSSFQQTQKLRSEYHSKNLLSTKLQHEPHYCLVRGQSGYPRFLPGRVRRTLV